MKHKYKELKVNPLKLAEKKMYTYQNRNKIKKI